MNTAKEQKYKVSYECVTLCKCVFNVQGSKCVFFLSSVHCSYTNVQKFGAGKNCSCFLKEIYYAHQGCSYLNKNTVRHNIMKYI